MDELTEFERDQAKTDALAIVNQAQAMLDDAAQKICPIDGLLEPWETICELVLKPGSTFPKY